MDNIVARRNLTKVTDAFPRGGCSAQLRLMPPEDVLLREYSNVRTAQFKSRAQRSRGNEHRLFCRCTILTQYNSRNLPSRQHIAHKIRPLHAARKNEYPRPIRKIAAQLPLKQGKLTLECRHWHHFKADQGGGCTGGKGTAHECGKDFMPCRSRCSEIFP